MAESLLIQLLGWVLVLAASGFDRIVGDPRSLLHPVQVMGWGIVQLQRRLEPLACGRPWALRSIGALITVGVVGLGGGIAWVLERWLLSSLSGVPLLAPASLPSLSSEGAPWISAVPWAWGRSASLLVALTLTLVALSSALAGRSLEQAVEQVLEALPEEAPPLRFDGDLALARQRLSWIVGRDTDGLDLTGLLRASAETASENAVDGLFAPLFWMLFGALIWQIPGAPGPLSLAWSFKAASTLDSMLGYRRGSLRWLGTAGARLDDLLTWLPCRLVAFTLPLVTDHPERWLIMGRQALRQGAADPSPNAGVSQAIYALVLGLQLGGESTYRGQPRQKPLVGLIGPRGLEAIRPAAVREILGLSRRLQILWLAFAGMLIAVSSITKTLT